MKKNKESLVERLEIYAFKNKDINCVSCRYWAAFKETTDGATLGHCKRFPPQIFIDGEFVYADVRGLDWCGEWKLPKAVTF